MPFPARSTVIIDDVTIQAVSAEIDLRSAKGENGLPSIGSISTAIEVRVDMHDRRNISFGKISRLFELANRVNSEKVVPIKLIFWYDEDQNDAICAFDFPGWVAAFRAGNPQRGDEAEAANHEMILELEPAIDSTHYKEIAIGN